MPSTPEPALADTDRGRARPHTDTHDHAAPSTTSARRLGLTLVITAGYMAAEVVGGLVSGSLALLADAGHMLSDAAALALALFAMWIAARPPTPKATYGFYRTEILAALANGAALVVVAVMVVIEAVERLAQPHAVQGPLMLAIAVGGLLSNAVALWILHGGTDESLNVRGAWLHVLSDALGSVGAIASGVLIWAFGWTWADPVASMVIALLVVHSSWALLKETVSVLMEGVPNHIDVDEVRAAMLAQPLVTTVHDLHVWTLASRRVCMSAHVVATTDGPEVLASLTKLLRERFALEHVTLQVEDDRFTDRPCHDCEQLAR